MLRILIALGSIAGGALHLRLYFDGYKDIPIENLGRSFLLNAAASFVAAAIVLLVDIRLAVLAPLAVANGTLVGFALSRTDQGIFGFTERGWNPSPDAALSVIIEVFTAVLCVVALAQAWRRPPQPDRSRATISA